MSKSVHRQRRRSFHVEALETRAMLAPVADFQLPDVNANSASGGEMVSPRDYMEQVSGWYFAHST